MKKVLILFGGKSFEHAISCKSAKSVVSNIDTNIVCYQLVGIDKEGNWYEYNDDIKYLDHNWNTRNIENIDNVIGYLKHYDIVFPLIHGTNGEDGKLQGMFDLFDIKYIGCDALTSSILMDKDISKLIFGALGINQIPFITINENYKINEILTKLSFPLIIKPANGGSSIGINKANNKKQLKKYIKEALRFDHKVVIEKFIQVRELEVAILNTPSKFIISEPGEIKSANSFYDYNAKYENEDSYTIIPDDISDSVLEKIKNYCNLLVNKLNIKGLSRIDFFLDKDNNIYLNEINTIPGFTDISMYPKLIENEGISFTKLINILFGLL